ncbi:hypothetical protein OBK23_03210 [Empedobacter falsenii]|uniref:hypothetical protein n=1 Tax=Empedobacter falsenii TaxID=343874 RepID=UPI003A8010F0
MSIFKAYKIWEKKQKNSDFNRIKINSSGSFQMKSEDLFNDKEEVKKYVSAIRKSLKHREKVLNKENENITSTIPVQ